MHQTEHHLLHSICLSLIERLPPKRAEALILAHWIGEQPEIFGATPAVIVQGRRVPEVDPQGWSLLGQHISDRLGAMPRPSDLALDRLAAIGARLELTAEEQAILRFLALQQRKGPVSKFAAMLQRRVGLSAEAAIAWCCDLDEMEVWATLTPRRRLISLGLVQTDSMLLVLRDDPYTLSGLLTALLEPGLDVEIRQ